MTSSSESRIRVWRITHERYAATAFDGIGAETHGGRFNSVGTRLVYAAGSLSLALLEMLVRVNRRERLTNYVGIPAEFDARYARTIDVDDLPSGWDAIPAPRTAGEVGDAWIRAGDSLALRVPSVVVREEWNYLINPSHARFKSISIGKPVPLNFHRRPPP